MKIVLHGTAEKIKSSWKKMPLAQSLTLKKPGSLMNERECPAIERHRACFARAGGHVFGGWSYSLS